VFESPGHRNLYFVGRAPVFSSSTPTGQYDKMLLNSLRTRYKFKSLSCFSTQQLHLFELSRLCPVPTTIIEMFSIVATLLVAALSVLPGGQAAPFDLVARQLHQGEGRYYNVGLGACGITNQGSDFVVAVSPSFYGTGNPSAVCSKSITVTSKCFPWNSSCLKTRIVEFLRYQ